MRIDGARWHFAHHVACSATAAYAGCWNYVLFHRASPVAGVKELRLAPFFRFAERKRLVSRRWFLASVNAGFEIWHGGVGLGTRWFRVFQ